KSPGTHVSIPGVTPVAFETSAVASNGFSALQVGTGDGVMRIVIPPQTIGGNDGINLLVVSFEGTGLYYAGVSIVNFNSLVAEANRPPLVPGLSILSHQEVIDYAAGGNQQLILQQAPVDPSAITGPVVLELRYDDTTRTLRAAYSLDGGATFAAPFGPLPLETGNGTASVDIAAVAYDGECPAGIAIDSALFGGLGRPGSSKLMLRARMGGNHRGYEPMRLILTDDGASGATVLELQLPDTLDSTRKCDPRDGWKSIRRTRHTYFNYSNAMPPDCTPGSAQGVQQIDFRWTGTNYVKMKLKKGSLPPVTGPIRLAIYRGTGPVNDCDGYVGVADCLVAGVNKAKCSINY
ncbi:MAG TPA: hypothetical protein VEM57_04840, partial [Candidatus Binatus sp.]|nr:hypothetical protein [Candidatus Binatus sp.]